MIMSNMLRNCSRGGNELYREEGERRRKILCRDADEFLIQRKTEIWLYVIKSTYHKESVISH